MRPFLFRLGVCITSAVLLTACSADPSDQPSADKKFEIGFMAFDIGVDPFVAVMVDSIKDEARARGIDLDVRNGGNDLNKQIAAVQDFVTAKKDAIIVYPGDPEGIVAAVKQAETAGIPVFAVNLKLKPAAPVITYVGADDYEYGKQQGALLVKAIGETGNVAVMMGQLGTSAQLERTRGLEDYLKSHPGIAIVAKNPDDWAAEKSLALAQDWATKYPKGQLAGIVAQGPQAVGAARWLKDNGRDEIRLVLGDYPADVRDAIQSGLVDSTVNQDPRPQGRGVVEAAHNWLTGARNKVVRPAQYLPLVPVTKDNVAGVPPAYS